MWNYEKRLQYPVHITRTNAKAAQIIMSQYGGLYSISGYIILLQISTKKRVFVMLHIFSHFFI